MSKAYEASILVREGVLPAGACIRSRGSALLSNDNGRLIRYRFSDDAVARDNHRILSGAWRLANFLRNPVFLWAHDAQQPPIGRVVEIGETGGVLAGTVEYATADLNPLAETIFRMVKEGYLSATSVSWNPINWRLANDRDRPGGVDFETVDLMEISQVPVPALPTALVAARSAGIDTNPVRHWAEHALERKDIPMTRETLATVRRAAGAPIAYASAALDPAGAVRFPTLGSQLVAIRNAAMRPESADPRLVRAPSGLNEGEGAFGGFLVQTNFVQELIGSLYEESEIASRCDRRPTGGPLASVKMPGIDETSRADGSRWGGLQSYWAAEADQVSSSLPRFRQIEFSTKKLICLVRGTTELHEDVPMLEAHIRRGFAAEAAFKLDLSVLSGSGAGDPLGIVNAPGTVVVEKEAGQASGTIVAENVRKMWSRLPASSRKRAVWLVNEDAETKLEAMIDVVGAGAVASPAAQALYMPAGSSAGNEYPLLKGRPVIAVEQCPPLGAKGDIVLADLSRYIIIDGGTTPALSVHVRFMNDEVVWRFVLRIDGQPAFVSPVTPYHGGNARSAFVTLQSR
ncbi:phage prohead protease, HK97 family/phage major capsid protein, HK97 family,TIGR01554 [Rhizobium sp. RU35A]|uniref:phage major capsid protein n=1 Tax=Rhizobium sp. RU35A TaxID=1907414 RepID=UPI0009574619|nr:phage major capsid protein [Rhizobium sp. RU35A]SIR06680.1 phage prohead protease, HK97 family/phage major capsid protein, HK97 family,TIGR01554 [Rhizobium sp. RU35A]